MSKLQQHYINFQSQQTIQQRINYLQTNQKELSQFNINIPNLIKAWETNNWPHLNKVKTDYLS